MPIFEYHCVKCDKDFEVLVLGSQEVSCPTCEGSEVKRLLSVFSHKSDGDFSSHRVLPAVLVALPVAQPAVLHNCALTRPRAEWEIPYSCCLTTIISTLRYIRSVFTMSELQKDKNRRHHGDQ